ncbi:MAG: sortase [Chloroflexi bacterium]|nr:sortase [Chloroflexota bacterium]
MERFTHTPKVNWQLLIAVTLLLVVDILLAGCQENTAFAVLGQREAHASVATPEAAPTRANLTTGSTITPTIPSVGNLLPTASPEPTRASPPVPPQPANTLGRPPADRPPASEIEAAGKMIPIKKDTAPKGPRKPPPTRLLIPSIGLDAKAIELSTYYNDKGDLVWETAPFAVGHHVGTPNPGEPGNVVISGHISSIHEGAVFKRLPEVKEGDGVVVLTNDRNYLYQVVNKKIVEPTQIDVMDSTSEETLTLITCVPDGVYTHRLIVKAKRI